jgi:hypothetical protein
MTRLDRRLDALEQLAEEVRLRPLRTIAEERGLDFERFREIYEACHARTKRVRAEGLSERQILEATAARLGIEPDELELRAEALADRFKL